ncbi:hypothetical protein ACFJGV_12430 [Cnuibacter sp. UC19_7]|uniref:hypothetical protein n=1 Tax=Cnuibacter sp. UC19_7 TaxID=3350166 RepID=UPI00366D282D
MSILPPPRRRWSWLTALWIGVPVLTTVVPLVIVAVFVLPMVTGALSVFTPLAPGETRAPPACNQALRAYADGSVYASAVGCLPMGFPEDLPLIEGPILTASSYTTAESSSWSAEIRIDDPDVALAAVRDSLEHAGFVETTRTDATLEKGIRFDSPLYMVWVETSTTAWGPAVSYTYNPAPPAPPS